ncbi:hypothetical protein NQZ68_039881 [Dissostichus eleginoides]|nr:hypothetical protein NQZ68_039881 [Dissostichus eleginoides]
MQTGKRHYSRDRASISIKWDEMWWRSGSTLVTALLSGEQGACQRGAPSLMLQGWSCQGLQARSIHPRHLPSEEI